MNKPTQQQVIEAYKKLPPPVREFLADPDQLAQVLTGMKDTHNLHVDIIGQVSESIGYLLLGLISSNEFKDALKAASVSEGTINEIISEINQKIFVPLRQEMMRGAGNVQPPKVTMPTAAPQPIPAAPAAGAAVPPRFFHLDNKLPPAPRPIPPATAMPAMPQAPRPSAQVPVAAAALRTPVPALSQPRAISEVRPSPTILEVAPKIPQPAPFPQPPRPMSAEPIPVQPKSVNILSIAPLPPKIVLPRAVGAGFRPPVTPLSPKPMDSSKLLEDHEEPHIEFHPPSPKATEGAVKVPPPPNLPGAMPPRVVPEVQPTPIIPKVEPPTPPAVLPKPYSADPYREPIE